MASCISRWAPLFTAQSPQGWRAKATGQTLKVASFGAELASANVHSV